MDVYRVSAITATVGGPTIIALSKNAFTSDWVLSHSIFVQRLLLDAFFTGASVEIELVPGSGNVVRRVLPFEVGKGSGPFAPGEYRVSRLATQQKPDGQDEHLEVFLVKGKDPEKAYNVYDQLLQQLLEASFGHAAMSLVPEPLHVEFDGTEIATIRLGKV
jgi:hypothetical protein